jgi:ornithine decarboxylase
VCGLKLFYSAILSITLALSYFAISRQALKTQLNLWQRCLPTIIPHYAVKCNNDAKMMRWMTELHPTLGFDCASIQEIQEASRLVSPDRIIYAQPCKKSNDIELARMSGIQTSVADSVEEIEKMAKWPGTILIRLLVPDKGSKQPFGKKFGAPLPWLPKIYDTAKALKLNIAGLSFHVGSECQQPQQYADAIHECQKAVKIAKNYGFDTTTIDIGGGFLADEHNFKAVADTIQKAKQDYFPDPAIQWIAEPGRFLAAPTHTLYTTVIGKKPVYPEPQKPTDPKWRITIDESIYGSFSNIPFDHQTPVFERLREKKPGEVKRPTTIFGRTCDSGDCVGDQVPLLDVEVGDILQVRNMGAYTTVTASEFNGFPKPERCYDL